MDCRHASKLGSGSSGSTFHWTIVVVTEPRPSPALAHDARMEPKLYPYEVDGVRCSIVRQEALMLLLAKEDDIGQPLTS